MNHHTSATAFKAGIAASTLRAYLSDQAHFEQWCSASGERCLPAAPETLAAYLAALTTSTTPRGGRYSLATIERRAAAVGYHHRRAGLPDPAAHPDVRSVLDGIRRQARNWPRLIKQTFSRDDLRTLAARDCKTLIDYRNRAMILLAIAGDLGRAVAGLDREHVLIGRHALALQVSGRIVEIDDTAAVRAFRAWLSISGITCGPVFRSIDRHGNLGARLSSDGVACIVKQSAARIGLDRVHYSGESLRRDDR
jgi:site-specific recombinase XerD